MIVTSIKMDCYATYGQQVRPMKKCALASLLCLQELDDFVCQTEKITTQELAGFNNLPCCISTELSAQHSAIPSLKATVNALDSGFPLHICPILDYDFSVTSKFKINILFIVPSLPANNNFCTVQSLTPSTLSQRNISGVCFTGLLSREDVMLVTCPQSALLCTPSCPSQVLHYKWSRPVSKISSP